MDKINTILKGYIKTNMLVAKLQHKDQISGGFKIQLSEVPA